MSKSVHAILNLLRPASPADRSGFSVSGIGTGSGRQADRASAGDVSEPSVGAFKNALSRAMNPAAAKRGATRPGVTVPSRSSAADTVEPAADRSEALRSDSESVASGATPSSEAVPGEAIPPEDFSNIPAFLILSTVSHPAQETLSSPVSDGDPLAVVFSDPAPGALSDTNAFSADQRMQALPRLESLPADPSNPADGGKSAKNTLPDAFPLALTIALAANQSPSLNRAELQATSAQVLPDSGQSGSEPVEYQALSTLPGFDLDQAAVQAMAQGMTPASPPTLTLPFQGGGDKNPISSFNSEIGSIESERIKSDFELSTNRAFSQAGNLPGANVNGLNPSEEASGFSQNTAPGSAGSAARLSAADMPAPHEAVSASDGNASFSNALDSAVNRTALDPETGALPNSTMTSNAAASADSIGLAPAGNEHATIPPEVFSSTTSDRIPVRSSSAEGLKASVPTVDAGIASPGEQTGAETLELQASGQGHSSKNAGTRLNADAFTRPGLDDTRSATDSTETSGWETGLQSATGSEEAFSLAEGAVHAALSLQDAAPGGSAILNPAISHTTAASNAPVGMPESPPPVLASNAAHPLDQVLEGAVYSVKNGHKELILRLNPDNLGEVRINLISHDNGRLNARLIAETPESRDLLQSQAQALQSSLEAQGIRVERLSVVLAGQLEGHSRQSATGSDFQASDNPTQNPQNQAGQQDQSGFSDDNAARQAMGDGNGGLFQQHRHGYGAFTSPTSSSETSLEPGFTENLSEQSDSGLTNRTRPGLTPHEGGQVSILA